MTAGSSREGRKKTLDLVHQTEDGPVHLQVIQLPEGGWKARFWGKHLEGYGTCKTAAQARKLLERCFAEMYPKHRCAAQCGPLPPPEPPRAAGRRRATR